MASSLHPSHFAGGEPSLAELTPSQREALATLIVTIERSEGWALVVGPKGSGKGEIIDILRSKLGEKVAPVIISAGQVHDALELCQQIALSLGLPACNYKARFLIDLRAHIESCRRRGEKVLLLIKDVHLLDEELLRELELMGNTDQFSPRVLNIFFFAQPEILEALEGMGSTNLKHNLRRFRRLEPRHPGRQAGGERRHGPRAFQRIDYSWGNGRQAAPPSISYDSPRQPAQAAAGEEEDILEKAFGPSHQPKTLPVLD